MADSTVHRQRWWQIQWFSDDDTPEERKWILKLDLLIVPFSILAYWVKYIDQANLSKSRTMIILALSTSFHLADCLSYN
jgi:hypothetical protein